MQANRSIYAAAEQISGGVGSALISVTHTFFTVASTFRRTFYGLLLLILHFFQRTTFVAPTQGAT